MLRMEQRLKLAPHMIQSMEILQLPILALQERIEQELNSNPVLELADPEADERSESDDQQSTDEASEDMSEKDLVVDTDNNKVEDFERLDSINDDSHDYRDYMNQAGPYRRRARSDEPDRKLEAIKNTAAPPQSLHDHVRLEQLHNKDKNDFTLDDLKEALYLVQQLEPPGVGARDLRGSGRETCETACSSRWRRAARI